MEHLVGDAHLLNRRLINLLSTGRLYLDHLRHTIIVQARYSSRRERSRLAVEAGIADHKQAWEFAQTQSSKGRPVSLAPVSAYILFHAELLDAIDAGSVTPEALREIYDRHKELRAIMVRVSEERKAQI